MLPTLIEALNSLVDPQVLLFILVGTLIGIVLGALPGIGGILGMAIILPLSIFFSGFEAVTLLISIYAGSMYGSSVSAILINVPGSAASAATTFDGYPMTQKGLAKTALSVSAISSAVGGAVTMIVLFALVPFLYPIVAAFGPPEIFLLAVLGIAMIAAIAKQGSMIKGIMSGMFGFLIMTVGIAPGTITLRYTFNSLVLFDGLSFIAIILGMFAISEMFRMCAKEGGIVDESYEIGGSLMDGMRITLQNKVHLIKSSLIGMAIGAVPGAGASSSNFIAYTEAVRSSKSTDFGEGNPTGVVVAESANNGTVAGSIMPLFAFGIPGSASTAIVLSAFLMHGISPGVELFTTNLSFTYSLIFVLLACNLVILLLGVFVIGNAGPQLTSISKHIIIPIVIVFAITGGYMLRTAWLDVMTVFVMGVAAFYMKEYGYSHVPLVLGAVLSTIAENSYVTSLQLFEGNLLKFGARPISVVLIAVITLTLFGPYIKPLMAIFRRIGKERTS